MHTIDLDGIKATTEEVKAKMRTSTDAVLIGNTELLIGALESSLEVLEAARHELTTLHGLTVSDGPTGWVLDMTDVLSRIDGVLGKTGSTERIRARFLELLAADEPDHPWVKRAARGGRATPGEEAT